ncbi:MAG: DUF523 domain-containing protein [Candidatus Nomurabacteria bacterium]|nr:DUF523 domain-containing protein [Candidatus Nomurabacteria bacterium]
MKAKIIVSACLAGEKCRWDGSAATVPAIKELVKSGRAIAVCPELLGGFPEGEERDPAEIKDGRVITNKGEDVTAMFELGASEVLRICKDNGVKKAILKDKSPSCGYGVTYNGEFEGKTKPGNGITADLLDKNGIEVISSDKLGELNVHDL